MKFTQNNHPTRLFGPTRLIGTWEYSQKISEFQAEGLGFWNFAWLGSNPSDAPVIWQEKFDYNFIILQTVFCRNT